jgi:hypothetical protein
MTSYSSPITAALTKATDELDTISVYAGNLAIDHVKVVPTGRASDYEKALREAGWKPVAWDGKQWTVEDVT